MMCAVSVALAMLEWTRTSYLSPNAANRLPVSSACSRPGSEDTTVTQSALLETRRRQQTTGKLYQRLSLVHNMHAVTQSGPV